MNANGIINHKNIRYVKVFEVGAYAILASCLIGQVFFLNNQVTAINVAMIGLGILFATMVTMYSTPIAKLLSKSAVLKEAEIFSLNWRRANQRQNSHQRHAA